MIKKKEKQRSRSGNFKWEDDDRKKDDDKDDKDDPSGGGGRGKRPLSEFDKFFLSFLHDMYEEGLF